MTESAYFVPVVDLLPYWPHDLVAPNDIPGVGAFSQRVGVTGFDVVDYDGHLTVTGTLTVWGELDLRLPLVDGLNLVLGDTGGGITEVPFELRLGTESTVGEAGSVLEGALTLFLKGYLPPYELHLPELDVRLRVDRRYLKPMVPKVAGDPLAGFDPAPDDQHTELVVRGAVAVSTATGVRVDGFDRIDLDYAQIGSTGIVIKAENVLLRLSDDQPVPDPPGFDLPEGWKGVFFQELSAYGLQQIWDQLPASVELTNWYFGTGGVTGKAAAVFDLAPDMTGRTFALRTLQLVLEQNALVQAMVQTSVRLGFFDDKVFWLDLGISNDPALDFPASLGILGAVSAEQPPGSPPDAGELVGLNLTSGTHRLAHLGVSKLGVRYAPDPGRDPELPPEQRFFDILVDGRVEVLPATGVGSAAFGAGVRDFALQVTPSIRPMPPNGLWLDVSEEMLTRLAAFPLSISRVGFGAEGDETWIGLDARVALAADAIGAAVKGLRVYFGGTQGVHLSFEGVEVRIVREPGFALAGFLAMTSGADPGGVAEGTDYTFRGGIRLFIGGSVGISMDGSVLFGTKSGTTFWYVALDAGFGAGIPLGSTGVSLFGAALMLGSNVAPNRQLTGDHGDQFNWYRDWYRPAPGPYSVINSAKWQPAPDRWALGAGATLGSADGKAWSIKAFFGLLFPGPVIIIDGRVSLFKAREPHTGPPSSQLIRGLVVLDFDENEFLLALEVDHRIPQSGLLMDVHAEGEIYARTGRPRDWHVAVGWYEPVSRRVRATALKLFNWDAYLILSGRQLAIAERVFPGIAFAIGYRTGFDARWKFGPVRVAAAAWFAADVALSFKPVYVLGQIGLHGELAVKAFGFGFELGLDARLALEAPVGANDLRFAGEITIHIGLPWPVPDIDLDIPISFGDASALPPPVAPLVDAASVTPGHDSSSSALYRREQPVSGPARLPLDGRLVIDFQRPMRSTWGPAPTPVGLARPDQVGSVWYRYTLTDVRVRVTPAGGGPAHNATESLFGQWALAAGDDGGPQATSLILWGTSPYPTAGSLTWPGRTVRRTWEDLFFRYHASYPCGEDPETQRCIAFGDHPIGRYDPQLRHQPDPARQPVVFRALPSGAELDVLRVRYGEVVQTPIEVVVHGEEGGPRCLRFAHTVGLGDREQPEEGTAVPAALVIWALGVELPAARYASGRLTDPTEGHGLLVRARHGQAVVAEKVVAGHTFQIEVAEPQSFDHLELLVPGRGQSPVEPEPPPCLVELCYTTVGMIEQAAEVAAGRVHWQRVLDPITETASGPGGAPFGTHLVHEPHATYAVALDIRTERADSVDGPWTAVGTRTETLTATVDGAPADLAPYVAAVVPGDGQRPCYADYDLRVTYNRQYVEAMYQVAGEALHAELVDGMGRVVEPVVDRSRTTEPGLPPDVELFVQRLVDSPCLTVDLTAVPGNDETVYRTVLATRTAYEVRLRGAGHPEPLYGWAFTTSRYRGFVEHVADLRAEPWDEALPVPAGLAAAFAAGALPGGAGRDLEDDAFRLAWRQHLGLPLGTLPERPDVTLLWDVGQVQPEPGLGGGEHAPAEAASGSVAVRALAIASPEPLLTDRTVVRLLDQNDAAVPLRWLRSRDGTRALAIPATGTTPAAATALAAGQWRLELRSRLAGVAGLPDLSRQGSTADEVATWPFTVGPAPARLVDPQA